MHVFYSPAITSDRPFIDGEEARHAVKVLRLREKDIITVINGRGDIYTSEIIQIDSQKCHLNILNHQAEYGKRNFTVHIAIAPTKNIDRIEWFVEKSVEIGVDKISFIQCQRSERKNINTERIHKIAVSAMKQSIKAYLPEINDIIPLKEFINRPLASEKFVGHLEKGEKVFLQKATPHRGNYCILIGPEGDFSPGEIEMVKSEGFIPVSLGNSRLRTETAGIVACHIFNLVNCS